MGRSQRHRREIQGIDSGGNKSGTTRDPHIATNPSVAGTATNGSTLTGTSLTVTPDALRRAVTSASAQAALQRRYAARDRTIRHSVRPYRILR